jgi:leucyl/phenylalanyl-tRNA--protein transferase
VRGARLLRQGAPLLLTGLVLAGCAAKVRPGQDGSWISDAYARGMCSLHQLGFAHSAEAWRGDTLVGGVYGLALGGAFYGESMFADAPDASKVAFAHLVHALAGSGFELIDCQQETAHLARFGARLWPRADFLAALARSLEGPHRPGPWPDPAPGWDGRTDAAPFVADGTAPPPAQADVV